MDEIYVPNWAVGPDQAMEVLTAIANAMSPQTLDEVVDAERIEQPTWRTINVGHMKKDAKKRAVSVVDAVGHPFGSRYRLRMFWGWSIEYLDPVADQVVMRFVSEGETMSRTLGIVEALAPAVVYVREWMRDSILRHVDARKRLTPVEVSFEEAVGICSSGVWPQTTVRPFVLTPEMLTRVHPNHVETLRKASRGERLTYTEYGWLLRDLQGPKETRTDRLLRMLREAGAVIAPEHEDAVRQVLKR